MSQNIDIEDKTIRTSVVNLLAKTNQLSAKDIFERLAISNKSITYPAVYKTLKILSKEKKVVKNNRRFSLSAEWIDNLKRFIENVEHTSQLGPLPRLDHFIKDNISETICFNTYGDADRYRKNLQMEYQLDHYNKKRLPYCGIYRHFKSPVIKSEKILQEIKDLKDKKRGGFLV